ncbi:hypothetical protein Tco_1310046 [Tanacetum coccineum]
MTTLKFADTHNMVAFLSKPAESDGFEQIVDFPNAQPIRYALTVNPTIYISCIEQFWSTGVVKTINREVQLHVLVDGKKIIISKASVRRDLKLEDEEVQRLLHGMSLVALWYLLLSARTNKEIQLSKSHFRQGRINAIDADEDITLVNIQDDTDKEMYDVGTVTALKSVKPKVKGDDIEEPNVPVNVASASTKVNAATTTTATIPTPRKGIFITRLGTPTITRSSQQPSQAEVQDKGKGKMIEPELVKKMKERLAREKDEANVALTEEWDDIQAKIEVDHELAQRLQAEEQEELREEEQTTNLSLTKKNHIKDLKNKSFDSIQKMFDRAFKRVNTFVDFRTYLVEGSSKRAGDELEQESTKKQKVDENKDTTELQSLMEVIPDEEEVAINAIPLATKPPTIVDWKIHKKGKNNYFQIIRADGSSKMYLVFSQLLKSVDKEDLVELYKLVKDKYGSTRPLEDMDLLLWGDLKTMFEPHVEDEIWKKEISPYTTYNYRYAEQEAARVESSSNEEDLDDADNEMFDVDALNGEEVFVVEQEVATNEKDDDGEITLAQALIEMKSTKPKAKIEADHEFTQRLQAEEQEELSVEEKAKLFQQLLEQRRKHFAAKRAEEKRNKPPTQAQQRKIMCTYLKNMEEKKLKDLKNKSFVSIQKMFDRAFKRVDTFVDFKTDLVEGSSKRAGEELEQESTKKQKVDDDKHTSELQSLMEVIPDEEEVKIDVVPLAIKSPNIIGWKIHKEGKKSYYQIMRADGKSQMYKIFSHTVKRFSREDLEDLYKLVKAKYESTRPVEDLDLLLWGDLKTMFEPHVEDTVWRNQQDYKVLEWKLYDSCGVHSLRMQHVYIYMLVEKRYPLTPSTITDMLNKKLQVDYFSEMAYQLLKLLTKQLKNQ